MPKRRFATTTEEQTAALSVARELFYGELLNPNADPTGGHSLPLLRIATSPCQIPNALYLPKAKFEMPIIEQVLPDERELKMIEQGPSDAGVQREVVGHSLKSARRIGDAIHVPQPHIELDCVREVPGRAQLELLLRIEQLALTRIEIVPARRGRRAVCRCAKAS